jgi:hypothetical protein
VNDMVQVHRSDLSKLFDVLEVAYRHHTSRDASNGALHLASQTRFSPLTSELGAALDRVKGLLEAQP